MVADPPKADPRVVSAYLDDVELDLDAAKRLIVDPPNRFAAFHLQQAAEKLVKAVRLCRGLRLIAEHNIELLVDEIPEGDVWHAKLTVLEPLAEYATSYRYPSSSGRRKGGPSNDEILIWIKTIAGLCAEARVLARSAGTQSGRTP
jgi:HEPN domain-containing protein